VTVSSVVYQVAFYFSPTCTSNLESGRRRARCDTALKDPLIFLQAGGKSARLIDPPGRPNLIHTVRGVGYTIRSDEHA